MKRYTGLIAFLVLAGCAQPSQVPAPTSNAQAPASASGAQVAPAPAAQFKVPSFMKAENAVIVRYKNGHDQSRPGAMSVLSARRMSLSNTHLFRVKDAAARDAMIQQLRANPNVAYAEPDYKMQAYDTPNDPDYTQQWDMAKINLPAARDITQGDPSVTVAVVDTGVDYTHPDLAGQVIKGHNFIANNDDPKDDVGHGTHCAGTIAALTNNGVGVAGIAPKCKILAVKVLGSDGSGDTSTIADGINYAVQQGAKVINLSLGGTQDSQTLRDAVDAAVKAGVTVVVAAGNDGNNQEHYPAAYPDVISVGATDQSDARASFSCYGSWVKVAAPGTSILSTTPTYSVMINQQENVSQNYGTLEGTSMASPHVAAVAALVKSAHPSWTPSQVAAALENSGAPTTGFDGSTVERLDAQKALQYDASSAPTTFPSSQPSQPQQPVTQQPGLPQMPAQPGAQPADPSQPGAQPTDPSQPQQPGMPQMPQPGAQQPGMPQMPAQPGAQQPGMPQMPAQPIAQPSAPAQQPGVMPGQPGLMPGQPGAQPRPHHHRRFNPWWWHFGPGQM